MYNRQKIMNRWKILIPFSILLFTLDLFCIYYKIGYAWLMESLAIIQFLIIVISIVCMKILEGEINVKFDIKEE